MIFSRKHQESPVRTNSRVLDPMLSRCLLAAGHSGILGDDESLKVAGSPDDFEFLGAFGISFVFLVESESVVHQQQAF